VVERVENGWYWVLAQHFPGERRLVWNPDRHWPGQRYLTWTKLKRVLPLRAQDVAHVTDGSGEE
jgi:hypothetical protein